MGVISIVNGDHKPTNITAGVLPCTQADCLNDLPKKSVRNAEITAKLSPCFPDDSWRSVSHLTGFPQ